jgi:hypothetical protein
MGKSMRSIFFRLCTKGFLFFISKGKHLLNIHAYLGEEKINDISNDIADALLRMISSHDSQELE